MLLLFGIVAKESTASPLELLTPLSTRGPPTQISINYLGLGNLCTHFVNLKTFCVQPPSPWYAPGQGGGGLRLCAHTQFVRIPQVCLHFRWFVVIAQCNLCDRRGKVNVDVPTIRTDTRDGAKEEEGDGEGQKNRLVQVQTDAGDRDTKKRLSAQMYLKAVITIYCW